MATTDARVDAYIARSADFAKPILQHLRALVHAGCPAVEETIKWNAPHFVFNGLLCSMAAFNEHCVFGFWNGALIIPEKRDAMGHFGRITKLADLPADRIVIGYVKKAAALNAAGQKRALQPRRRKGPVVVPADLQSALRGHRNARTAFEGFSTSHKREYVEWITEAKTAATRQKRLATAIDWIAEGKPRNWKYMSRADTASRPRVRPT
jgi:uncharacterized protein YdeI (YjbR/CyaY-like superfamily)